MVLNPFAEPPLDELHALFAQTPYRTFRCEHILQVPQARRWLTRTLDGFKPDITHVHLFHAEALTATLPPRITGVRLLTHHHGDFFSAYHHRGRTLLDRWAGARFDSIIAVSSAVRGFLLESYRYPADKVVTILNGWEGEPVPPALPPEPTVVCTANFRTEKGHRVLIDAWGSVRESLPDAELVLIGDGPLRPSIEEHVQASAIEGVRFLGTIDDVWSHLARAHVFAFPSLSEPLGIAVMEAMAAGLPVVASEVGGIPELVSSGVTGELVPPGDAKALARGLTGLLADADRRQQMGIAAQERAKSLTMAASVDRYFEHYERLLKTR